MLDLQFEVRMIGCKLTNTPIFHNHKPREHIDQVPTIKERYQRLVGKPIYLSNTHLDITYAINVVS